MSATLTRTLTLTKADGRRVSAGEVQRTVVATPAAEVTRRVAATADHQDALDSAQIRGRVIPGLLTLFAVILLGFAGAALLRRRPRRPEPPAPSERPVPDDARPVAAGH